MIGQARQVFDPVDAIIGPPEGIAPDWPDCDYVPLLRQANVFFTSARLAHTKQAIVLSVPNVGHYSIVEDLIAGRWDYVPIGLLCFTHVRFLTRATLEDWIARVGFAAHQIIPQATELPERFQDLPESFAVDLDSLRTKRFYLILEV